MVPVTRGVKRGLKWAVRAARSGTACIRQGAGRALRLAWTLTRGQPTPQSSFTVVSRLGGNIRELEVRSRGASQDKGSVSEPLAQEAP